MPNRAPRGADLSLIITRAQRGDAGAIRLLYLCFNGDVHGYALSIVRNDHDAEDVVQQVFTRMMTAIQGYEQRSVPFSAWLLRITRNTAIDMLRRRRVTSLDDARLQEDRSIDDVESVQLRATLREALAELPHAQREIIVLRHLAGMSPGEIAAHLGRSEDSVHGLHHRGRRTLRRTLAAAGATPVTFAA